MSRSNRQADPAAGGEFRSHDHFPGGACPNEVVEDVVCDRFIESALIAIRGEVKFERFCFNAAFCRPVIDRDPREIGLASDRAERGEIRRFEANPIGPDCRIGKCFEDCCARRGWDGSLAATEKS